MLGMILLVAGVACLWGSAVRIDALPRLNLMGLGLALICTAQFILPLLSKA